MLTFFKNFYSKMLKKITYIIFLVLFFFLKQNILAADSTAVNFPAPIDSSSSQVRTKSEFAKRSESAVTWHQMITNIPSDYYRFFRESFSTKMIPGFFTVAFLTGSLMVVDQNGWTYQHNLFNKSKLDHRTSNFMVNFGNGTYQFLSAAAFAIPGLVFHDETALRTGSNIAEAILTTGIFVQVLKRITGRESPIASTEKGGDWQFVPSIKQYQKNQPKYYSFPSGHLSTATAVLTVIANNYPEQKWIKPVGYPLLALLGFSLVNKGMHWYSDLPLAYFLGYTFGNIITPQRNDSPNVKSTPDKSSLTIFPSVGLDDLQFNLLFSF
ncbi:MAG: phosphatase PAP2 family protein [Ignavibacteriaceae bacterium]